MSELITDKLTGKTAAGNVTITDGSVTMQLQQGVSKSWASIDQTTTGHPVYDSLNVSSTADTATGETTVTYTNIMSNDDYALTGGCQTQNYSALHFGTYGYASGGNTTSKFRYDARDSAGNNRDGLYVCYSLKGDLA